MPASCLLQILARLALSIPAAAPASRPAGESLPSLQEVIDARTDPWGEAAMRQPGGASYEFFEPLLPPLRYVNTAFRHYPIMLSAPLAPVKTRFVSNGSGINLLADSKPMWRDFGTPIRFLLGTSKEVFGADVTRVDGPRYLEGWLPIVQVGYPHDACLYRQEAFAPVEPQLAEFGTTFVRFTAAGSRPGTVTARVEATGLQFTDGSLTNEKGELILQTDVGWTWDAFSGELTRALTAVDEAVLVVFTRPPPQTPLRADAAACRTHMNACRRAWTELLQRARGPSVPEPRVNDAWRSMVVGNFMTAVGDRMHYSAGNLYDKLYEGECGDTVRAMLLYGYQDEARRMIGPLLDFNREATRFHVAGHKLQLVADYYRITRDDAFIRATEPKWKQAADFIVANRDQNGLALKDRFAGDIDRPVYGLHSNAACWRGLRDIAMVLADMGRGDEANRYAVVADAYQKAILKAVEHSERRDTTPPFIPIALFENDEPYDPLTATRLGSYYNLVMPYVLGSGLFAGTPREDWLVGYLEQHGGIAMGMIRSTPHQGQFKGEAGVNVLYGLRYMLTLLRRDEREKAITGFYGHLAQAMTRDTYIGGEGSRFRHGDANGRSFYLPPNTSSNAMFMLTLRCLLMQDWDMDSDMIPETLRLLYAAPRQWLADGKTIEVRKAPTAFGEVSLRCESRLSTGEVRVSVTPPPRTPKRMLLRVPVPQGWRVTSARIGSEELVAGRDTTVDLTGHRNAITVVFGVARR